LRFLRRPTEQYHVVLAAPGIARDDPRRYAGTVLDTILGGSSSSRLFQEVREKGGGLQRLLVAVQYQETGQIGIYVGTREENLGECMQVIATELADVAHGNLRDGELARAKENIEGRILLAQESTSNRMTRLGRALSTDVELLTLRETLRRIDRVTGDDVATLAAAPRLSAAAIGPRKEGDGRVAAVVPPRWQREDRVRPGRSGWPLRPCSRRSATPSSMRGGPVLPGAMSRSTSRARTPSSRTSVPAWRRASRS
jgi:predicted Zn-dependent peptidase